MLGEIDKAEREWRSRTLFRRPNNGVIWLRRVVIAVVAVGLVVWQDETLVWLANLLD